ncbi:MAG: co-chaperone GroES [Acidimicrobiales bacterium]
MNLVVLTTVSDPVEDQPAPEPSAAEASGQPQPKSKTAGERLPIKMLGDRLLVSLSSDSGERRSSGGILIPATAQMSKRLVWGEVVGTGSNVRGAKVGDRVLFSPEDRYEVEVQGDDYIILRERDLHAIAATRVEANSTGLYL